MTKTRLLTRALAALALTVPPLFAAAAPDPTDPYLWLEDIDGARAMAWVKAHNDATAQRLGALPQYAGLYRDALAALSSASRLPEVEQHGRWLYNLWQDAAHPRGVYRRTTLAEFGRPDPHWEILLDIDALSKQEGTLYAFNGARFRADERRALIELAPGGGDAAELREFDVEAKAFVPDGFRLPAAKSRVSWRDADTLSVATDFGAGSLTRSGYPREVRVWQRGTPLAAAAPLYEAPPDSVSAYVQRVDMADAAPLDVLNDEQTFWSARRSLLVDGKPVALQLPGTARIAGGYQGRLVLWLKADWTQGGKTWPAGSILLATPAQLEEGAGADTPLDAVFVPDGHAIVRGVEATRTGLLLNLLDNVRGRLIRTTRDAAGWHPVAVPFPDNGTIRVVTTDAASGAAIVEYQSFLTPPSLWRVPAGAGRPQKLKSEAATFDAARFEVTQYWTVSADGTRVPYFVVGPKAMKFDAANPVWMFAYGGFEEALTPSYSGSYEDLHGAYGKLWLERGGVFVLANIRGGGEFGPAWHTAALGADHVKAFEDFEAVAADLATRRISAPRHIGIEGRSNGGLLVSSTMLRHPELYGAVVCGNPLIDMQRYNKLLAGASWQGEYGDPDKPEDWAFISRYSPYQRVAPHMSLPPVMFYSTTRDDRVHPGHARKMAAKMADEGYAVEYFENVEGGHHGPVVTEQLATRIARTYAFLWSHVGSDPAQ
ncbi:MAG: S9 family peptidase [Pelomonas sp.]|nr:S9 family peptidase [Roseateles sp.]